ncbi:MAG: hypothetical protein IT349_05105 [Candidatus Eisenbacteria bacterium]|nr:hypothetical protein [Candidatus Eisenbacteria bacterium]
MTEPQRNPNPDDWESLVDRLLPDDETARPPKGDPPPAIVIYSDNARHPESHQPARQELHSSAVVEPIEEPEGDPVTLAEPDIAPLLQTPSPQNQRRERLLKWLAPAVAVLIALALGWWATAPSPALSPDSLQYISAAKSIAGGHGLTTAVTPLEIGPARIPFSAWPPLFPMLLALGAKSDAVAWARTVNVVCFALTLLPLAFLARWLLGAAWGAVALLTYACFRPALLTTSFIWSETLFTLWCVAALACLVRGLEATPAGSEHPEEEEGPIDAGTFWIIGAGLFAALASLTRYTGFALIGAGAIAVVLRNHSDSGAHSLRRLAAFLVPAALPITLWCARNQFLTGHIFGEERVRATQRPAEVILDTIRTLGGDWIAPPAFASPVLQSALIWTAGIAAVALVLIFVQRFGPQMMESDRRSHTTGVALSAFAILYTLLVVVSTMSIATDRVNTRLLLPSYPALLLLGFMMLRGARDGANRPTQMAIGAITTLLVASQLAAGPRYAGAARETQDLSHPYWRSLQWARPEYEAPEAPLLARLHPDALIISNVWDRVALHSSHPTKPLPGKDEKGWPGSVLRHANAYILIDPEVRANRVGITEVERIGVLPPGAGLIAEANGVRLYRIVSELGPNDLPRSTPVR